jgi:hypothetical protein
MRSIVLTLALLGLAFSEVAQAALPPPIAEQIAALPIDRMCSKDGASGLKFGATEHGISPIHKPGSINRDLGTEFAPFREAALGATKYSNKFFTAAFRVDLGDKDLELEAVNALALRFEEAGWILGERTLEDDGPFYDIPPEEDAVQFYSAAGVEYPGNGEGVRLLISVSLGELTVDCEHVALTKAHMQEALGQMPADTPRPKFISSQSAFGFPESDCDDPAKRELVLNRLRRGDMFAMAPGVDQITYEERLADWKIMKLEQSGKISRDEISDKIIGLLDNPESMGSIQDGLSMMEGLMDYMDTAKPGDDAGLCRAINRMLDKGAAAAAPVAGAKGDAVTPQWRATHELLDREAARLGVSFADE